MRLVAFLLALLCAPVSAVDLGNGISLTGGRYTFDGPVTFTGTLNYFGTSTSDWVKLSSQSAGDGTVYVSIDKWLSDFRPFEIRASRIKLRPRIPDATDPNGYSTLYTEGMTVDKDAINAHIPVKLESTLQIQSGAYIIVNDAHCLRINRSDDSATIISICDNGIKLEGFAGSGNRPLYVNSQGYITQ